MADKACPRTTERARRRDSVSTAANPGSKGTGGSVSWGWFKHSPVGRQAYVRSQDGGEPEANLDHALRRLERVILAET
mgnify:CR=1 FL=1